jgi:hypothetical protein
MMEPDGSVTAPRIVARLVWAKLGLSPKTANTAKSINVAEGSFMPRDLRLVFIDSS